MSSKYIQCLKFFHTSTRATIQYDSSFSNSFEIICGVNTNKYTIYKDCVLAQILFRIFFSNVLKHAFGSLTTGFKFHSRTDVHLFNAERMRAKHNLKIITNLDLLFADDAALSGHTSQDLQKLLSQPYNK